MKMLIFVFVVNLVLLFFHLTTSILGLFIIFFEGTDCFFIIIILGSECKLIWGWIVIIIVYGIGILMLILYFDDGWVVFLALVLH